MKVVFALFVALVACCGLGCSFGIGSAYVGQWRPHDQVDFEACLVDQTGKCVDKKQVVSHIPGRNFWGTIIALPALGAAQVEFKGETSTQIRAQASLEVLKGSGRWAVGIRAGFVNTSKVGKDANGMPFKNGSASSAPIDVLGHLALLDRLSVYGGVGFSPIATIGDQTSSVAGRALAGLQFPLNRTQGETYIMLSLEIAREFFQFDDPYRATGVTGHLGIFF